LTALTINAEDTHKIPYRGVNKLLADSTDRGWEGIYASLAHENPWSGTVNAVRHIGLAFCIRSPTKVRREIDCDNMQESACLYPRQFSILPPDLSANWQISGKPEILLIYVHRSIFRQTASEIFDIDPTKLRLKPRLAIYDPLVETTARQIQTALMGTNGTFPPKYINLITKNLVSNLILNHSNFNERKDNEVVIQMSRTIDEAVEFMKTYLSRSIKITDICAAVGLSEQYFKKVFRAQCGTSPHQYLISLRVARAEELLQEGRLSLAEICYETGFSSQSHLTNAFKKMVGTTPKVYRENFVVEGSRNSRA